MPLTIAWSTWACEKSPGFARAAAGMPASSASALKTAAESAATPLRRPAVHASMLRPFLEGGLSCAQHTAGQLLDLAPSRSDVAPTLFPRAAPRQVPAGVPDQILAESPPHAASWPEYGRRLGRIAPGNREAEESLRRIAHAARARMTVANVVAFLALFVALGGSPLAAPARQAAGG